MRTNFQNSMCTQWHPVQTAPVVKIILHSRNGTGNPCCCPNIMHNYHVDPAWGERKENKMNQLLEDDPQKQVAMIACRYLHALNPKISSLFYLQSENGVGCHHNHLGLMHGPWHNGVSATRRVHKLIMVMEGQIGAQFTPFH